ncbi:ABC transporter permease subunit [Dactylosporangium sp. NPDC049140]|uniref:ABC transporter permease subunit n=1 Tax=Dactylosporangium sp. NPDC049140 TaxID=3155647 RepID=UPI0033E1A747
MIWLSWRQHRNQLLAAALVIAALSAAYLTMRGALESYLRTSGLIECLSRPDEGCGDLIGGLRGQYPVLLDALPYLNLVPALVGLFWGAPLVAGEVEAGTHRLTWAQGVGRQRWLWTKVTLLGAGCVVFGLIAGVLDRWFLDPYFRAGAISPVQRNWIGLLGVAPAGYALFAFTLGAVVGTYVRRNLPAMVATLAVFVPVRFAWESIRYRLTSPVRAAYPLHAVQPAGISRQDWRLDMTSLVDEAGNAVGPEQAARWCAGASGGDKGGLDGCLAAHGVQRLDWYVPAGRFWHLQALDTGVFATLAAFLLVVLALRVARRVG